jgi:hypothetical protein
MKIVIIEQVQWHLRLRFYLVSASMRYHGATIGLVDINPEILAGGAVCPQGIGRTEPGLKIAHPPTGGMCCPAQMSSPLDRRRRLSA